MSSNTQTALTRASSTRPMGKPADFLPRALPLVAALAVSVSCVSAAEPDYQAVEAKLREIAPGAATVALSETPIAGLLQAQINNEIVYVSDDGGYLLQGTLFDIDARVNVTDQARSGIRKELLAEVDPARQISFAPDDPQYELMVFTDIDCGYCRKLHEQISAYNEAGIAIHYMAFPRAGVGSDSYDKYVSVWCADDPQQALTLAKSGIDPEPKQCENPVLEQYELGQQVGVTGTPALLTSDGQLIPGYMAPETLKTRLEGLAATP